MKTLLFGRMCLVEKHTKGNFDRWWYCFKGGDREWEEYFSCLSFLRFLKHVQYTYFCRITITICFWGLFLLRNHSIKSYVLIDTVRTVHAVSGIFYTPPCMQSCHLLHKLLSGQPPSPWLCAYCILIYCPLVWRINLKEQRHIQMARCFVWRYVMICTYGSEMCLFHSAELGQWVVSCNLP